MGDDTVRELSVWELFEAPRPARTLRQLPGLLARAIRFVLTADRTGMVLVTALALVAALGSGVAVLVTQRVLADVLTAGRDAAGLGTALPALALLALVNIVLGLARTLQDRRREVLTELVSRHAEERVLSVTTHVQLADFDDPVFHDRVQRASHGTSFGPLTLVQGLTQLMTGLLGAVGLIVALGTIAPLLVALVLLGYLPAWVALQANGLDRFRFIRLQTPLERRRSYVFWLLSGRPHAKEVRAYGLAEELLRRWRVLGDQRLVELRGDVRRRARRELVGDALSQTLGGGTLLVLAWMLASGRLSVPQAGAAGAALLGLRGQLTGVTFGAGQLYEASLFVADYEAFMAVAGRVRRDAPTATPAQTFDEVTAERVTFTYPGASIPALVDVDLRMRAGEVVALVGENGSGKTTLAKLLAGLYHPTSGRICWDGIDLATIDGDQLRRGVAVVFQDFEQYAFTAYDNIAFGNVERLADEDGVRQAARRADADVLIKKLPDGYDTLLGRMFETGTDLSVGQWQRVALARAFFRDAPLVILDEPTAALDARAEHDLFARIRELYIGRAVLLISHRFSTVRTADRIYVLDGGKVVESGDHRTLMSLGGRYAELFTLQARAYQTQEGP